jgi:hypothetical protein
VKRRRKPASRPASLPRGHIERDAAGRLILTPCPDDGRPPLFLVPRAHGAPILPGQNVVAVLPDEDGRHVRVQIIATADGVDADAASGPPQVVSDAYRSGWDSTFRGVN